MKNPAPYLREKIGDLLDGNVTYDSALVPVYGNDEDHDDTTQIVIGEYSDGDRSNKNNFGSNASQVVEVIRWQATGAKMHVDSIGEQVTNLIHPTTTSNLLSNSDFSIMVVGKPSINHLTEDSGSGQKIVRLLLRYNLLIIEN